MEGRSGKDLAMQQQFDIRIQHRKGSDLLMATIEEIPGFIVHAYSLDELEGKLAEEFKAFMDATGTPRQLIGGNAHG